MAALSEQSLHSISEMTIPILDLGPYLAGEPEALQTAAATIRQSLASIGFFILINHGVAQDLINRTFAEARRFHDQPLAAKMALRMNAANNGYMAMGKYAVWTSEVNANDKPDLNEAFFVWRERRPDDPLVQAGRRSAGPNRWPKALPGFRDTVLIYTEILDTLARRMLPVCAVALDLPVDYFDTAFQDSHFTFRMSHYPPVQPAANQFGIAPHTDANFLTFLAQTDVPGLQVRLPSGGWCKDQIIPHGFRQWSMMTTYNGG